jgi:hypothetical protein
MNFLLPEHPFLNLLKPETEAAIPLVLYLNPDRIAIIRHILALHNATRRAPTTQYDNNSEPRAQGNMGGKIVKNVSIESIFSKYSLAMPSSPPAQGQLGGATTITDRYSWLVTHAKELRKNTKSMRQCLSSALSLPDKDDLKSLQDFLRPLKEDNTFDLEIEKDEYSNAAQHLLSSGEFKVVIFGHTHLPKKIELAENTAIYINAGAWADIMRLPDLALEDTTEGHQCLKDFLVDTQNGNIEKYIYRSLGYAEIVIKGSDITSSDLRSFCKCNPRGEPLEQYVK